MIEHKLPYAEGVADALIQFPKRRMNPEQLMQLAIDKAREGISRGQSPFGCAIARDGQLLACTHNTVRANNDITAHAEINALRMACAAVQDIHLAGAIVVSTCEPCPMCMAALHWARVERVFFGATISDATEAGFNELPISASDICRLGRSAVQLVPGLLTRDCQQLFTQWLNQPGHRVY